MKRASPSTGKEWAWLYQISVGGVASSARRDGLNEVDADDRKEQAPTGRKPTEYLPTSRWDSHCEEPSDGPSAARGRGRKAASNAIAAATCMVATTIIGRSCSRRWNMRRLRQREAVCRLHVPRPPSQRPRRDGVRRVYCMVTMPLRPLPHPVPARGPRSGSTR